MRYIPYEMVVKLKKANFSFPEYEHLLNYGMVYHYQGEEYTIGGMHSSEFAKMDKEIAENGVWLPDTSQLLEWLTLTEFDFTIQFCQDDWSYNVSATDRITNAIYHATGRPLAVALAALVRKICKSNLRQYIVDQIPRPEIDPK